jgi:NAD(P)-dependent dehydrogenase (short-subunit alcohol dehydrogenase family)
MKLQGHNDTTSGDVAVVTGAASGIGLALSTAFANRGLAVVMSDVREPALQAAADALAATGARVLPVVTDVSRSADVELLAARTMSEFGRVDVVCNNAGVAPDPAPMWELPLTTWQWVIDVALLGVIHGIRSFAPLLIERGRGHIVNTASVGGLVPLPGMGPYNAVKHAVIGLSETLQVELRKQKSSDLPGVGVSVLCPGLVDTGLPATSRMNHPNPDQLTPTDVPTMASQAGPGRSILSAATVAELTIAGIETDRLHIITHPDGAGPILARLESVRADLPTI